MYTPGFAAPEQYLRARAARALDRHLLGRRDDVRLPRAAPRRQPADERLEKDELRAGAQGAGPASIRRMLLDIVDWCLRLDHLERPQSVFALQKALLGEKEPERRGDAPLSSSSAARCCGSK